MGFRGIRPMYVSNGVKKSKQRAIQRISWLAIDNVQKMTCFIRTLSITFLAF